MYFEEQILFILFSEFKMPIILEFAKKYY